MKIRSLFILLTAFLLFENFGSASQYQIGFKANQAALGVDFAYITNTDYGAFVSGANFVLNNDDHDEYRVFNGSFFVTSDPFLPGLRYGLGFAASIGPVEDKVKDREEDLLALGFLFHMGYNHNTGRSKIPADLLFEICLAPDPLTANDADIYLLLKTGAEFSILNNASLSIEYRYMKIDFDDNGSKWKQSDGIFLLGYKIKF